MIDSSSLFVYITDMIHPLESVPALQRKTLFWLLLGFTLAFFALFQSLDLPLRTPAAPSGIISFQMAGNFVRSQAILNSWNEHARMVAAFGLGVDFLFMPIYALALAFGTLLALHRRPEATWIRAGIYFGWCALLAPLFDALENSLQVLILFGNQSSILPVIVTLAANIKFLLFFLPLFYSMAGWLFPQKRA